MMFKRPSEDEVREEVETEQGFLSHLKELRDRLRTRTPVVLRESAARAVRAERNAR